MWPLDSKAHFQQKVATYFFQGFAGNWESLLYLVAGGLHIAVEICMFWQAYFQLFVVLLVCWKNREPSAMLLAFPDLEMCPTEGVILNWM